MWWGGMGEAGVDAVGDKLRGVHVFFLGGGWGEWW